jgi:hypothetical protein
MWMTGNSKSPLGDLIDVVSASGLKDVLSECDDL